MNMMINSAVSVSVRLSTDGCEKCRGQTHNNSSTDGNGIGIGYNSTSRGNSLAPHRVAETSLAPHRVAEDREGEEDSGFLTLLTAADSKVTLSVLRMLEANAVGNAAIAESAWTGANNKTVGRVLSNSSITEGLDTAVGVDARNEKTSSNSQDASSQLVHPELHKLVSLADPTKSLEELSVLMELSLQEVRTY